MRHGRNWAEREKRGWRKRLPLNQKHLDHEQERMREKGKRCWLTPSERVESKFLISDFMVRRISELIHLAAISKHEISDLVAEKLIKLNTQQKWYFQSKSCDLPLSCSQLDLHKDRHHTG
jgi:hypothetical protein